MIKRYVVFLGILCAVSAAGWSDTFQTDGNLTTVTETTESGNFQFVVNEGFTRGKNHDMVFGGSVARSVGAPTALWDDSRREKVLAEVLVLAAQLPPASQRQATDWAQRMFTDLGWTAGKAQTAAKYLDSVKADYWSATTDGANLHNTLARWLRTVSRQSPSGGRVVAHTVNLRALGHALGAVQAGALVSHVAVGACLRAAYHNDRALDRLDLIAGLLRAAPDPAMGRALQAARRSLTADKQLWTALLDELSQRRSEFARMGGAVAFKAAMKALGAKGTLGVLLVVETIMSDWDQHATAQSAVMAATLEKLLSEQVATTDAEAACEVEKMVAMLRFVYFDCMMKVTSVWQGAWVDLLSRGRPYRDAREYFTSARTKYSQRLAGAAAAVCAQPLPSGCGPVHLVLILDSSGSMKKSDPGGLRKEAASLLVDRAPHGTRFSVVDFDSSANVVVSMADDPALAKRAAARVDANGGTNIAAALKTAHGVLASGSGVGAAVLFTDGKSSQRGGADAFERDGIPIHVVGLGPDVDGPYLQRLAASTGGVYIHASTAAALGDAFDRVVSDLACEGTIVSRQGTINPGQNIDIELQVGGLLNALIARVTWPGSRIDVELIDPDGNPASREVASGPTYRIVEAAMPAAGRWTARLIGTDIPSGGEPYMFRAGGPSDLRASLRPADPKDPKKLVLEVDGPAGVSWSDAWSRVRGPDGSTVDGPAPVPSGAGAWSLELDPPEKGTYTVTAGLVGDHGGRTVRREVTRSVFIGTVFIPWMGRVSRVEGSYLTVNRGASHGIRPGMRVELAPNRGPGGTALVTSVLAQSCTVEVQELFGSTYPERGMRARFDRRQWSGDWR